MSEEKRHVVIRYQGKSYFGLYTETDEEGCELTGVVELITSLSMTPTGVQKRVIVVGLDYSSAPIRKVFFPWALVYGLKDMPQKDAEALMGDYEAFCNQDNLVKPAPQQPTLFQP